METLLKRAIFRKGSSSLGLRILALLASFDTIQGVHHETDNEIHQVSESGLQKRSWSHGHAKSQSHDVIREAGF